MLDITKSKMIQLAKEKNLLLELSELNTLCMNYVELIYKKETNKIFNKPDDIKDSEIISIQNKISESIKFLQYNKVIDFEVSDINEFARELVLSHLMNTSH